MDEQVFDMMKIDNFVRAMTFLTLVYVLEGSEDQIRSSVLLVASVFKRWISLRIELREVSFEGLLNISGKRL